MNSSLLQTTIRNSLDADAGRRLPAWGILLLRAGSGAVVFYVHGWHKLEGAVAYFQHGTPWRLAEEVARMHFPAPLASALFATAAQFLLAPLLVAGLFTRASAAVLTVVLSVAILQNVLSDRDPQLAVLFTLVMAAFVLIGGGPFSLDARLAARSRR